MKYIKYIVEKIPVYLWIFMGIAAGLFIAGFLVPPVGVINGSVLKAGAILIGGALMPSFFETLGSIVAEIGKNGGKISASYGEASITYEQEKNNEEE